MDGEVLSFDVNKPYPKHDINEDRAHVPVECKLLIIIEQHKKIVDLCVGQNHIVVIGINGSCYWLGLPIRVKKIKPIEVATKKKAKKGVQKPENIVDEWEPIDPSDYRIIDEIHLNIEVVTSVQYRKDEEQLLLGSSKCIITIVSIDAEYLQDLIATKSKLETSDQLVEVMWESRFHNGSILAINTIKLVFKYCYLFC